MLLLKHILFPVDFSERARGAVPFVDAMATRFGAKVTLISVAPPVPYMDRVDSGAPALVDSEDLKSELQAQLDGALVGEFAHLSVQRRIAEAGEPAEGASACQFAIAEGVDLIMMPTHTAMVHSAGSSLRIGRRQGPARREVPGVDQQRSPGRSGCPGTRGLAQRVVRRGRNPQEHPRNGMGRRIFQNHGRGPAIRPRRSRDGSLAGPPVRSRI